MKIPMAFCSWKKKLQKFFVEGKNCNIFLHTICNHPFCIHSQTLKIKLKEKKNYEKQTNLTNQQHAGMQKTSIVAATNNTTTCHMTFGFHSHATKVWRKKECLNKNKNNVVDNAKKKTEK